MPKYDELFDELDILSEFLNIDVENLVLWSDDTITLKDNDKWEYIITEKPVNHFMYNLGYFKGVYIYKN